MNQWSTTFFLLLHRDTARVLFFCPTEKHVEQMFKELEGWFPDINVECLVGHNREEKPPIHELITTKSGRGRPLCQVNYSTMASL